MRLKLTIVLVLLNLGAFYWIYVLEKQSDPKEAYLHQTVNILSNASGVDQIRIQVKTAQRQEERVIARTRTGWEITSPYVWPANDNAIQRILTQLQFLEKEVSIPLDEIKRSGQTLADFGLEDPSIVLSYKMGEKEVELKIGAPTQLGKRVYLLPPGGDAVLVVSDELLKAITIGLAELRSDRVFDIPLFEVRSLTIEQGEQRYRFEESGDKWWLESPIRVRADNDKVDAALGQLTALRSVHIVRDLPSGGEAALFATPYMRITLGGNNRRRTLQVGAPVPNVLEGEAPQRYARLENDPASGTIFTVEQKPLERLSDPADRLRQRKFFVFNPAEVNGIEITEDGKSLTLQRLEKRQADEKESWQIFRKEAGGKIVTQPADTEVIGQLLQSLRVLEAKSFASDAPSGKDLEQWGLAGPKTRRVTLRGGTEQTLLLGVDKDSDGLYAKLAAEPFVYKVGSLILQQINSDPLTYRSRVLDQSMAGARVVGLTLTDLNGDKELFSGKIDTQKETWTTYWSSLPESEREAALNLVDQLENFRVSEYEDKPFKGWPDSTWRYRLSVDYFLPGSQEGATTQRVYDFSPRERANYQLGGSSANGLAFVLTQPMIDALFTLTFVQDAPKLPSTPEGVEKAEPLPLPQQSAPSTQTSSSSADAAPKKPASSDGASN
ncbi:DUF4340 domain-containing protein [Ruficoccus sp. ZRK36]|uniref:DUF4340 domain-containing protein n=1 Tax=Ruficoccus sp. ZRK36 TaxID=2866311 RepID=UPI001C73108B|nr:DUF4340 domain-containing protein [Ruficoccus sp. ZRK36]QYY36802.1 DUF4340 domain-containing protein [Ruficoccus sp. ZRK36]